MSENNTKTEKRSFNEVFLTPIIIAVVGLLGTFLITRQQIKSANTNAKSELQIKLLEIFSDKITSKSSEDRELAVRILNTLDEDLAKKLASVIVESNTNDSLIRSIAGQIIEGSSYVVVGSDKSFAAMTDLADSVAKAQLPYSIQIFKSTNDYYAVCIGGKMTLQSAKKTLADIQNRKISKENYIRTSDRWIGPLYAK
jgi:hypothetical protein